MTGVRQGGRREVYIAKGQCVTRPQSYFASFPGGFLAQAVKDTQTICS